MTNNLINFALLSKIQQRDFVGLATQISLITNLPDPLVPIMQLNLLNGPMVCFPRQDLKFSTSNCFKKPIFHFSMKKT